ncbi:MAG: response regulator [Candidatus Accumulibacter delftensis]|jgi:DNA-binding response OmpR family regulator
MDSLGHPDITVEQWFTRDDAEAAIARENYDLVVLDIELGRERHAGVAIINAINKGGRGTPVLVVSAMPATIYRSIMKALDAWDYLQKTTFSENRLHRHLPGDPARALDRATTASPLCLPVTNSPSTRCARQRPGGAASGSICR